MPVSTPPVIMQRRTTALRCCEIDGEGYDLLGDDRAHADK
jgi:hypothetical protein